MIALTLLFSFLKKKKKREETDQQRSEKGLDHWNPIYPCRPAKGQTSLNFDDMKEAYKVYTYWPQPPITLDVPEDS